MAKPKITAHFVDKEGNKRDLHEIKQVIHDVFFPPPTPEQAKAAAEYFAHYEEHIAPLTPVHTLEVPQ